MHKIDTATAVDNTFVDGDPSTGRKATQLNAAWFKAVQNEIINAITAAGLTPAASAAADAAGGYAQLTAAIRALRDETGGTWKTFPLSAATLNVDGWTQNAIVLPSVWLPSISYSGTTIKDAIMIVVPKWSAAGDTVTSCTFAQTEGATCPILRENVLLVRFGADGKVSSSFSLPASAVDTIAEFGKLTLRDVLTGVSAVFSGAVRAGSLTVDGELDLPAKSIATSMLEDAAVTSDKIAANSVVEGAIVDGAVAERALATGAVAERAIAGGAVTAQKIYSGVFSTWSITSDLTLDTAGLAVGAIKLIYNADTGNHDVTMYRVSADGLTTSTYVVRVYNRTAVPFVYLGQRTNTSTNTSVSEWGPVGWNGSYI